MQQNEEGRVSNRVLLQRFAKERNEKQKLAKNLKTAGSNPLGVRIPRPPWGLRPLPVSSGAVWEGLWEGFGARMRFASTPT
jgi:hypothetical protein